MYIEALVKDCKLYSIDRKIQFSRKVSTVLKSVSDFLSWTKMSLRNSAVTVKYLILSKLMVYQHWHRMVFLHWTVCSKALKEEDIERNHSSFEGSKTRLFCLGVFRRKKHITEALRTCALKPSYLWPSVNQCAIAWRIALNVTIKILNFSYDTFSVIAIYAHKLF